MATPTPRLTPMPEGCPTASEERCFLALAEHTAMIGNSSFTMGELMLEAGENPLMMFDDAWIILVAFEITTINAAADAILGMDSPSSTSEIRDYAWSMAQYLKDGNDLLIVGIDNADSEALEAANIAFINAAEQLDQSTIARQNFCN